jgi:hypothetical protein
MQYQGSARFLVRGARFFALREKIKKDAKNR